MVVRPLVQCVFGRAVAAVVATPVVAVLVEQVLQ
jgi:hypothetical protein